MFTCFMLLNRGKAGRLSTKTLKWVPLTRLTIYPRESGRANRVQVVP